MVLDTELFLSGRATHRRSGQGPLRAFLPRLRWTTCSRLPWAARVSGCRSNRSSPIPGARVRVLERDLQGFDYQTNGKGRFRIPHVGPVPACRSSCSKFSGAT